VVAKDPGIQMIRVEQRDERRPDRRGFPRGGRRADDRSGRHPNVLVAESYAGARVPCARYLTRFGFQVEEAADGEQALTLINHAPPNLIIVELGLPHLSAGRLTRWLAQNWRTRHIPVIVLAGDAGPSDQADPPPNAAGMLVKPFQLAGMLEEVRRVIRAQMP
jgi:two-component system KDP operon response regulator KdpE